jgi:hypothetical protein
LDGLLCKHRGRIRAPRAAFSAPSCPCASSGPRCNLENPQQPPRLKEELALTIDGNSLTPEQGEKLKQIRARLVEARRELDALIGDAYLRPRASIVPVHFLDLASAVEKLRWAEKEWRELDQEIEARQSQSAERADDPRVESSHPDLVNANN